MKVLFLASLAFLLGSLPTGLLIAKVRGVNLKETGSGNIGATNVLRTTGKGPALLTLVGDSAKGAVAVLIARYFGAGVFFEGVVGLCAVLGHNFSLFLKFRGGKGVATSLGVLTIYSPQTGLLTIIIWLMTVLITRYSSLGALVSFGLLPLGALVLDSREKVPLLFLMTLLIFVRHKDNIRRIIKGTEPRIGARI
ncbi:MAG: glycerol-3-phosphate 1-O-acyltransferase PlsY [Thermodesulfovibrionales bacterium]